MSWRDVRDRLGRTAVPDDLGEPDPSGPVDLPLELSAPWRKFARDFTENAEEPVRGSALQVGGRVMIVVSLETLLGIDTPGRRPLPPHIPQTTQDVKIAAGPGTSQADPLHVEDSAVEGVFIAQGRGTGAEAPLYVVTPLESKGAAAGSPLFVDVVAGDVRATIAGRGTAINSPLYTQQVGSVALARGNSSSNPLYVSGTSGGGGGYRPGGSVAAVTNNGTFSDSDPLSQALVQGISGGTKIPETTGYYRMVMTHAVLNAAAATVFGRSGGGILHVGFGNGRVTATEAYTPDDMVNNRLPGRGLATTWLPIPENRRASIACPCNMEHAGGGSVIGATIFLGLGIETLVPASTELEVEDKPRERPRDEKGRFIKAT